MQKENWEYLKTPRGSVCVCVTKRREDKLKIYANDSNRGIELFSSSSSHTRTHKIRRKQGHSSFKPPPKKNQTNKKNKNTKTKKIHPSLFTHRTHFRPRNTRARHHHPQDKGKGKTGIQLAAPSPPHPPLFQTPAAAARRNNNINLVQTFAAKKNRLTQKIGSN